VPFVAFKEYGERQVKHVPEAVQVAQGNVQSVHVVEELKEYPVKQAIHVPVVEH
jgi:hypothetical protein